MEGASFQPRKGFGSVPTRHLRYFVVERSAWERSQTTREVDPLPRHTERSLGTEANEGCQSCDVEHHHDCANTSVHNNIGYNSTFWTSDAWNASTAHQEWEAISHGHCGSHCGPRIAFHNIRDSADSGGHLCCRGVHAPKRRVGDLHNRHLRVHEDIRFSRAGFHTKFRNNECRSWLPFWEDHPSSRRYCYRMGHV